MHEVTATQQALISVSLLQPLAPQIPPWQVLWPQKARISAEGSGSLHTRRLDEHDHEELPDDPDPSGGGGEDDPEDPREPQSEQSVPRLQMLYSLPAPPSSQYPSNASLQLLEQDPELVPELVHSAVIRASRL